MSAQRPRRDVAAKGAEPTDHNGVQGGLGMRTPYGGQPRTSAATAIGHSSRLRRDSSGMWAGAGVSAAPAPTNSYPLPSIRSLDLLCPWLMILPLP